jgi:aryl-alcohol dehydrogenase-like predicted oxidoreductase
VIVATKGGHTRNGQAWEVDGRPEHIRAACEASLRALETDRIDLYQYHRPDPRVPYAETIGAFKELQDEGKVRWIGLSNANVEQLEEALSIVDVVSVQNQLALNFTSPIAKGELAFATERGLAFLPWSPLGGIGRAGSTERVEPVTRAAEAHGVSPQRVVLAWLLALGPTVIPIPGSSRPETIADSARAAELALSDEEVRAISEAAGVG